MILNTKVHMCLHFSICEIANRSGISPKHDIVMAYFLKKNLLDLTRFLYLQTIKALLSKKVFLKKEVTVVL